VYICQMPRGRPKRPILFRLEPALVEEVKQFTDNVTGAVEEGLAWWLKRARRQAVAEAKPDLLAKHLAPPTARELAARRREGRA
jgi:hypothetical protein